MYKEAIRNNYKFQTNVGELTVGQLFTASDATLIQLEEDLKEEVKKAKKPNRFQTSAVKDKEPKIKLKIVSDIIDTFIEERETIKKEVENKANNQKILEIIKRKQDSELEDKTIEELEALMK
jgi:hypothetical protein